MSGNEPVADIHAKRYSGELDWLFREQPTEGYGIDAYAEVIDGEDVRGRLLALQRYGMCA